MSENLCFKYHYFFLFQTLLRTKDNEVLILKNEISCLQSEVQSLTQVCHRIFFKYTLLYTILKFILDCPVL